MPLNVYANIRASGSVPDEWQSTHKSVKKYPIRNKDVQRYLQTLLPGQWKKVIIQGNIGEVHYFEHASGSVAGVKFLKYTRQS